MKPLTVDHKISSQQILTAPSLTINLPAKPRQFYRHGWQSWSLTAWLDADFQLPISKPTILHPMQVDPLYANHLAPNGSWVGAVDFNNDGKILLLGALGLEAHVALHGNQLHGWYETGAGEWFVGVGLEQDVFDRYANLLKDRFGKEEEPKPAPRVWCSWYSLYTHIDEAILGKVFEELDELPFDVLQVDDGWQVKVGDWQANDKFPAGMTALADKIKATGRQAGLWLAPLIAVKSSYLFREHRDWFLKDLNGHFVSAGFNWGEQLYALDTTHPAVLEWLTVLMKQVRIWGFDYLKLDFLYGGALPGKRFKDTPRETAYRQGLSVLRESMEADAFFLTCGAPIIPSLGLCDALRVGPDVAGDWETHRDAILLYNPATPGVKNAIRTTVNRYWLQSLVHVDPDVTYFCSQKNNLSEDQKKLLQNLAQVCKFKATSDLPHWWTEVERDEVCTFLEADSEINRVSRYAFRIGACEVDFSPAITFPPIPSRMNAIMHQITSFLGNQTWVLNILHRISSKQKPNGRDKEENESIVH